MEINLSSTGIMIDNLHFTRLTPTPKSHGLPRMADYRTVHRAANALSNDTPESPGTTTEQGFYSS